MPTPTDYQNANVVYTTGFSNRASEKLYRAKWPQEPEVASKCERGVQCGGCSFFAKFNADWGLCCHGRSHHHLETVFEHFTCPSQIEEGWGPHSFTERREYRREHRQRSWKQTSRRCRLACVDHRRDALGRAIRDCVGEGRVRSLRRISPCTLQ